MRKRGAPSTVRTNTWWPETVQSQRGSDEIEVYELREVARTEQAAAPVAAAPAASASGGTADSDAED